MILYVKGFDISHWNGTLFWTDIPDEFKWCFIKATEGDTFKDELFPQHWQGAYQENILRAAYHFWRYSSTPASQVAKFRDYVGEDIGEIPPVFDIEDVYAPKLPWKLYEHILECLQLIEAEFGKKPIIYTAAWYWDEWVKTTRLREYDLVVANYKILYPGAKPYLPKTGSWTQDDWCAWQHSETGRIPGIDGHVDLDRAKIECYNKWSKPTPPSPSKTIKVLIPDGVEVIVEKIQ